MNAENVKYIVRNSSGILNVIYATQSKLNYYPTESISISSKA